MQKKKKKSSSFFGFHVEEGGFRGTPHELDLTTLTDSDDTLFRLQSVYIGNESRGIEPIVFDSGASISVSPSKSDFISWEKHVPSDLRFNGIEGISVVKRVGLAKFRIQTDQGQYREIVTRAYYIPKVCLRLLSVQRYMQPGDDSCFHMDGSNSSFRFPCRMGGRKINIPS